MLIQQLLDTTDGEMTTIEIDLESHRLIIDGKARDFANRESLRAAYIAEVGALLEANDDLYDLDNSPARLWDLDSIASYEGQKLPAEHPALETARQALYGVWEDHWQVEALTYAIALDTAPFYDPIAGPQPVGISKQGGSPDLPPDVEWPGERVFLAQLDLASLASLDVHRQLPDHGLLSLFIGGSCGDNAVFYFEDTSRLARRETPAHLKRTVGHYKIDLTELPYTARPVVMSTPFDTDDLELPDAVLEQLRRDLGLDVTFENSVSRLFGELDGEPGIDGLAGPPRPADIYDPATFQRYAGPLTLALQLQFLDGFIYLVVPPGDLRQGDMRNARVVYWGT